MYLKAVVGGMLLFLVACQPEVEQIQYGKDGCTHCKMTISDRKYGAELVTQKGKVFKFDAVECMLEYVKREKDSFAYQMVVAYNEPGILHPADSLTYLVSPNMPSPMGEFLTAFSSPSIAQEFQQEKEGKMFSWPELKNKMAISPDEQTRIPGSPANDQEVP